MRRTFGLSYKERQEQRAKNKAAREATANLIGNTLKRLSSFIEVIEESFKPEANHMRSHIIARWIRAFKECEKHNFDEKAIRFAYTGIDFSIPLKHVPLSAPEQEYFDYKRMKQKREILWESWCGSAENFILTRDMINLKELMVYAKENATQAVEDAKYKLFQSIAKKLYPYQTIKVIHKNFVRNDAKGFQGDFILETEQGTIKFECKAVPAEGDVQCFHYRYLAHIKK